MFPGLRSAEKVLEPPQVISMALEITTDQQLLGLWDCPWEMESGNLLLSQVQSYLFPSCWKPSSSYFPAACRSPAVPPRPQGTSGPHTVPHWAEERANGVTPGADKQVSLSQALSWHGEVMATLWCGDGEVFSGKSGPRPCRPLFCPFGASAEVTRAGMGSAAPVQSQVPNPATVLGLARSQRPQVTLSDSLVLSPGSQDACALLGVFGGCFGSFLSSAGDPGTHTGQVSAHRWGTHHDHRPQRAPAARSPCKMEMCPARNQDSGLVYE
jgi:hypothetical protein